MCMASRNTILDVKDWFKSFFSPVEMCIFCNFCGVERSLNHRRGEWYLFALRRLRAILATKGWFSDEPLDLDVCPKCNSREDDSEHQEEDAQPLREEAMAG